MRIRTLCIKMLLNVLMLLVTHVKQSDPQKSDADFQIVPFALQVFEYKPLSFTCHGVIDPSGWKVRHLQQNLTNCLNDTAAATVTCTIDFALSSDDGEYWCEGGEGERSNTVKISVTCGSVILESPVRPVMGGDNVILRCRNKSASSVLTAHFYKDGVSIGNVSSLEMTILSVSKSHEGLYKCSIPGYGESPESRLTVKGMTTDHDGSGKDNVTPAKSREILSTYYILLWSSVTALLVLQLLVIGLLLWKKHLVSLEIQLSDQCKDFNSVVKKDKTNPGKRDLASAADKSSPGLKPQTEKDTDKFPCQSFCTSSTPHDPPPFTQNEEPEASSFIDDPSDPSAVINEEPEYDSVP